MIPRAVWLCCLTCLGCQAVLGMRQEQSGARPVLRQAIGVDEATSTGKNGGEEQDLAPRSAAAERPRLGDARTLQADLLLARGRHEEAREQYRLAIVEHQKQGERRPLLHCHGKLVALAQSAEDEYEVQLQRGIGLWLLAQERACLGDPEGDVPVEGLLCKAAASLMRAHALRRDEARPCWYLHEVWRQLAQPQQADRWLKQADHAALFTGLTPWEQQQLVLAGLGRQS